MLAAATVFLLLQWTTPVTADLYRSPASTEHFNAVGNRNFSELNQQANSSENGQYLHNQRYVDVSINQGPKALFKDSVSSANISASNRNLGYPGQYSKQLDRPLLSNYGNTTQILDGLKRIVTESFKTETGKEIANLKNKANNLNAVARELEFQSEELRSRASEQSKITRRNAEYMRDQVEEQVELLRNQGEMIRIQAEKQSTIIRKEAEQIRQLSGTEYEHLLVIANSIEQHGRKQIEIVRKQASQLRINLRDQIEMMNLQGQAQASQMQLLAEQISEQATIFRIQATNLLQPTDQMLRSLEALTELMESLYAM